MLTIAAKAMIYLIGKLSYQKNLEIPLRVNVMVVLGRQLDRRAELAAPIGMTLAMGSAVRLEGITKDKEPASRMGGTWLMRVAERHALTTTTSKEVHVLRTENTGLGNTKAALTAVAMIVQIKWVSVRNFVC